MPSAAAILASLSETANSYRWVAVIWHLLLAALAVAFVAGWWSSTRVIAWTAIGALLSVSAVSWASNNLFNAITFAVLAMVFVGAEIRRRGDAVEFERSWRVIAGAALVMFGLTYPHFLKTASWTEYVYAAPFGVVPCATLSVAIGLTLMIRNVGTAAWKASLVAAGVLYGLIGVLALHVLLDLGLLSGALVLAIVALAGGRLSSPRAEAQPC